MLGVLLVDKPRGITSHDAVNRVRRVLGTRRVGHAGTLDPIATGLLVMAVGPATRFLQYLPLEPKVYEATIRFGQSSTTYDSEGELSQARPTPDPLLPAVEAQLPRFQGLIEQVPPMFSAIKVDGQPLYKYARQGKELEREARRVHISAFDVLSVEGSDVRARIVCSGGTYIRSLAHDLGEAVGCGAHLVGLERTAVGRFHRNEASPLEQVSEQALLPLREALAPMPTVELDDSHVSLVRNGRPIGVSSPLQANLAALLDPKGRVFSIARITGNLLHPECVIPAEVFDGTL